MPSPGAATNPPPSEMIPGLHLPKRQPLYRWQFTKSRPTSSLTMTSYSLPSSKTPSTTPRRSRLARPGTLIRTELRGPPSRPLRWSSPLTPTTFPSSSPPSSSSQSGSRSKKRRKLTATPNASTATISDTPTPDAPKNIQLVPIAHFTILAQRTAVRTPPAPRAAGPNPFQAAAPPPLPTARTAATTLTHSPGNIRLHQSANLNPMPSHLPTKNYPTPPLILRKPWMWARMAAQHPLLPMPPQPFPSTFPPPDPSSNFKTLPPPPSGSQPAPTGRGLPPVTLSKPSGPARK